MQSLDLVPCHLDEDIVEVLAGETLLDFISSAGGSNNAATAAAETSFHFDCRGEMLPLALERFSDFFVSPLFTESATSR